MKKATEYEQKRLENIKRNEQLLASLNIKSKLSDLSASKRQRAETKSYKVSPAKKVKSETPIVIRRSLRTQGKAPDLAGLKDDFSETPKKLSNLKSHVIPNKSPRELIPISMRDAKTSSESDEALVSKISSVCKESRLKDGDCGKKYRVTASVDLDSMKLAPENVARVVPNRILSVKLFPSTYMNIVVVGNKFGDVGFWNVDSEDKDGDGIYMYHPHPAPVSAIVIQPFSLNKIITSCYDGQVRSLDIEKEMFDLAYSSEHAIFSMFQRLDDVNSLFFGEGHGVVRCWDERSGKTSFSWELHETRINTIDFNPENVNMMATSSTDRTVCIWDLRKLGKSKPNSLKMVTCERAVQSAYFSPSGSHLATTSLDDKIGVLSGANYDDEFMINHNNQTGRWLSTFKGVWGWDDSHIYVGNMRRGVDIISAEERRLVTTLDSPHMTAIPCRFDAHPLKPGMLAGATSGGQVYIWST
uniref:WD repeat-containing protein 76-like n=1 Tax=Erigeron canadensis TaxID=72917 RepID=UPI001CB89590|nr:WD repeat-containing protein 76-like [Erigeron canadensis]XP_043622136.1 WD repeat-containing protein 76-like [Erigeron canadensis]